MSIGFAIRHRLLAYSALATLVGSRVYNNYLPQNYAPRALVYQVLSEDVSDDISGTGSLFRAQIQIESWSKEDTDTQILAEHVRKALQGYSGVHLGVNIIGIHFESQMDNFQPEVADVRVIQRYGVWYRRPN